MNQKGGVGKSTSVVNIGAAIAAEGRSTLIVDLDPQGHASLHLGIDPAGAELNLYELLLASPEDLSTGAVDPNRAVIPSRTNLDVLASTVDLAAAEAELADLPARERRLSDALRVIRSRYEFILIDCPPSLGLLTLNGLAAAREVIVPMQAHFLALQGLGRLLETVQMIGAGVNPKLRVSGVILCMHDESSKHAREVVADMEKFFEESRARACAWSGARVYRPAVRRNIKLAECPSFGQTIFEYAPSCPGAMDYRAIAGEMVAEWDRMLARREVAAGMPAVQPVPTVTVRPASASAVRGAVD